MRSNTVRRPSACRSARCALLAFSLFLVVPRAATAASPAHIAGTVRDAETGAPVASATVYLPGLARRIHTDDAGHYRLEAAPGPQRVLVSRMGFASTEFEAIVPDSGTLEIHVELRREPVPMPPIEVHGNVPLRSLSAPIGVANADRAITRDALNHDPRLVEPDYLRAMSGGDVVIDPENPSGLYVRGGASDQVGYVVDGIPVFNPYHSSGTFSAWNPDAISQVDLLASAASPDAPDALSGTVSARTRNPGSQTHTRGSVSATQVRATVDGPVGRTRTGYLFSVTSAFPGLMFHNSETSHLQGNNLDLLGKTQSPLAGGQLRLLGYLSHNHVDAATTGDGASPGPLRNTFGWDSRSVGLQWTRDLGSTSLTMRSWYARGEVDAAWTGSDSLAHVDSNRDEAGGVAMLAIPMAGGRTNLGCRVQQLGSNYAYRPAAGDAYVAGASTPLTTVFVEHDRPLHRTVLLSVSLADALAREADYLSPTAQLQWTPAASLTFTGTAARRYQFGQSLRNPESVISNIFPAEMYLIAGPDGAPVAASTIGILAMQTRPAAWLRFGLQSYARDFSGLALVAPDSDDPFATSGFVEGTGHSYGFSANVGANGRRLAFVADYGYQNVRLQYPGGGYVPGYGTVHSVEAGVNYMPAPGYSIRLGYQGMLGRTASSALGDLEYESVNLLDEGGEFGGSPVIGPGGPGGTTLPGYHRLDLGFRKSWLTRIAGHDGMLAAFGTVSNLMARSNVLTYAVDPATGARAPVEMRPLSPLVVGIDWQF